MRRLRTLIQSWIPILGALVIFAALIVGSDDHPQMRLGAVLAGILIIEAGVWGVANPFLPSERKHLELRAEVDGFILMVRALNTAALEARASGSDDAWRRIRGVRGAMHEAVDHMVSLAGKSEEDVLPLELPEADGAEGRE